MPDIPPIVRRATTADREAVTATLARAFTGGPVAGWLYADVAGRMAAYHAYANVIWGQAIECGDIEVVYGGDGTASDLALGAAVWFPHPTVGVDSTLDEVAGEQLAAAFGGEPFARLATLDEVMAGMHPKGPHAQLAFVGVLPAHQNRGLASLLLREHHRQLDETGTPGFLVATSYGAHRLYMRHGYQVTQTAQLPDWLDEGTRNVGPSLWAMVREPLPFASASEGSKVVVARDIYGDVRM